MMPTLGPREPDASGPASWLRRSAIFGIVFLVAGAVLYVGRRPRPLVEPQKFVVSRGSSARQIARQLKSQGFIRSPSIFLLAVKFHPHAVLKPGVYFLSPNSGTTAYVKAFTKGPPLVRFTIPEGWTARQVALQLEDKGIATADVFLKKVAEKRLEGYLFPDTYFFEQESDVEKVMNRMKSRFDEMIPKDFAASAKALRLTEPQLVILASLVEREARVPEERPVIAGVFLNRLRRHWRLESCATVEYALGQWRPKLTYKDLEVESPYNTYRHAGLPPGPICNPGAAALEAASHPASTDAMFFVAEGGGTHRFSKYYAEHLAAQRRKQK